MANINVYKVVLKQHSLAFTIFKILYDFYKLCDLDNIDQSHDAQHSQSRHQMTNINVYKVVLEQHSLAFTIFQILHDFYKLCDLDNIDQSNDAQHSQSRHQMTNINVYKSRAWTFASSHHFPDIIILNGFHKLFDLENIGNGHDAQHSQWSHSMTNKWFPIWWQ